MLVLITLLVGELFLYLIFPTMPIHVSTVIFQFIFILLPSVLYLLFSKSSIKSSLRLNRLTKKSVLISLLIGICSIPLVGTIGSLSELVFYNHIQDSVASFPSMPLVAWIGILALTPTICEEVFMRGVVLNGYKNLNLKKAALMNGFLFGMFHMNLNQFVYTFILGIILTYTVSITNSIFSSMIIHFTFNSPSAIATWATQNSPQQTIAPIKTLSDYAPGELISFLLSNFTILIIFVGLLILLINSLKKNNNYLPSIDTNEKREKIFTAPIYVSILIFLLFSVGISFLTNTPV
jgi:membrane protease YdiL (CAAX protease family)